MNKTESDIHVMVMYGSSKRELDDKLDDFLFRYGDNIRVIDVTFQDSLAKILYEFMNRNRNKK